MFSTRVPDGPVYFDRAAWAYNVMIAAQNMTDGEHVANKPRAGVT